MQKAGKYRAVPITRSWGFKAVVAVGTVLMLGALPSVPWAASAGSGKIGFIDMKRLERESLFGQGVAKRTKEEQAKEEQELKVLDEEADTLHQAVSKLSPEERKQKEAQLKTKAEGVEQRKAERPKKQQAKQEQLSREFRKRVQAAVQAYAKEEGFVAIFLRGRGLFYGDEGIDVTGPVLERMNKQTAKSADGGEPASKP